MSGRDLLTVVVSFSPAPLKLGVQASPWAQSLEIKPDIGADVVSPGGSHLPVLTGSFLSAHVFHTEGAPTVDQHCARL